MKIDYDKLQSGLNKLTGLDFEQCEAAERAAGNTFPEITFSKSFQARLAARALNINPHDIKNLPVRDYQRVCSTCFGFLFGSLESATPAALSEK